MLIRPLEQLRSQVLTLSEQDRVELAHDLLQSLDTSSDEGIEEAWELELLRRIKQVDSGQAKLFDRTEFTQRMHVCIGKQ